MLRSSLVTAANSDVKSTSSGSRSVAKRVYCLLSRVVPFGKSQRVLWNSVFQNVVQYLWMFEITIRKNWPLVTDVRAGWGLKNNRFKFKNLGRSSIISEESMKYTLNWREPEDINMCNRLDLKTLESLPILSIFSPFPCLKWWVSVLSGRIDGRLSSWGWIRWLVDNPPPP
jgi:hypothetical protein